MNNDHGNLFYKILDENKRLKYELDAYKIALEYFAREGGQPARDIISNMLKELEVVHD